jgi:hypothetical protein
MMKNTTPHLFRRLTLPLVCLLPFCAAESGSRTGFDFLRSEIGARPAAMAGTLAATMRDLNGLSGNPASLAGLAGRTAAFTYVNHVLDFQSGFAGYSQSVGRSGQAAVGVHYMNYGTFTWRDILGEETGTSVPSDWVLTVGYADSLSGRFRYGISGRYIRSTIAGYWADAMAVNIGAIYSIPSQKLNFGAGLFNAGKGMHAFLEQKEKPPLSYRIGVGKQLAHLPLLIQLDLIRFQDQPSDAPGGLYWALGGEFTLSPNLSMRWGYQSRGQEEKDDKGNNRYAGVSFGLGLRTRFFLIDAAINQFGMLGTVAQFSVTRSF